MYYKIENKESEVYKKLYEMRTHEINICEENKKKIEETTGLTWNCFLGYNGQQNFRRTTQYSAFEFVEKEKIDPKIWILKDDGMYHPNRRTKKGREMSEFLANGLKGGNRYDKPFEILGITTQRSFTFPFVEIGANEVIVCYFDDNHTPNNENVTEITRTEFNAILSEQ